MLKINEKLKLFFLGTIGLSALYKFTTYTYKKWKKNIEEQYLEHFPNVKQLLSRLNVVDGGRKTFHTEIFDDIMNYTKKYGDNNYVGRYTLQTTFQPPRLINSDDTHLYVPVYLTRGADITYDIKSEYPFVITYDGKYVSEDDFTTYKKLNLINCLLYYTHVELVFKIPKDQLQKTISFTGTYYMLPTRYRRASELLVDKGYHNGCKTDATTPLFNTQYKFYVNRMNTDKEYKHYLPKNSVNSLFEFSTNINIKYEGFTLTKNTIIDTSNCYKDYFLTIQTDTELDYIILDYKTQYN